MRNPVVFLLIFGLLILSIDFYSFRGFKKLIANIRVQTQFYLKILFWAIPSLLLISISIFLVLYNSVQPPTFISLFHFISGCFILIYAPKLIFIFFNLIDDIILLSRRIKNKFVSENEGSKRNDNVLSRRQFIIRTGAVLAGIDLFSIAYGIGWGRFNFTIRHETVKSSKIPKAFNGLRIVQLSDLHIGSFANSKNKIIEAVKRVNEQKPDLILFTGDFVNNLAKEIDGFLDILSKLSAKYGKYSILGNHDYGSYVHWASEVEKQENMERLKTLQKEMGFELLLNESRELTINNSSIELLGVENWGQKPFPQYGDISSALANTNPDTFKILLSHDPTHWDEQILGKTEIDLTLSGHTHGAQMGVELGNFRWSPVNLRYKHWGGMYTEGEQKLYVNTGIGFIGFPGRVGMPPEITVIELQSS